MSVQWQRWNPDNPDPATGLPTCSDIPGAMSEQYVPVAADVGYDLRMVVTASTPDASQTIASNISSLVPDAPQTAGVSFSGEPVAGQTITADSGIQIAPGLPTTTEYDFVRRNSDWTTTTSRTEATPTTRSATTTSDPSLRST